METIKINEINKNHKPWAKIKILAARTSERIIAEPFEVIKDPKTGKTISRKNSMIMAAGAAIAGAAVNDQLQNIGITEIFPDDTPDNTVDAISSDSGNEVLDETASLTAEENSQPEDFRYGIQRSPNGKPGTINDDMSFSEAFCLSQGGTGSRRCICLAGKLL